jgi:hypothetical protein
MKSQERTMRRWSMWCLTLLLPIAAARAQETTGDIRGRLLAPDSTAIAGAEISATSPDLLGERRAVSARDGVFLLLGLPPGQYTLRVRLVGHRPLVIQNVLVRLGRTTGLGEFALEPAGVVLEAITITAPSISLDPVRTTIGATLEAADYDALPAERDYKSLIAILPHVNASYHGDAVNSAGSTGLENMYFIDGVNVTSPLNASGGTSLPFNFVRSVEVRSGGYEAQYGRALGAVVNAVTYTGTNTLDASVFGFFTHDALAMEPRAQPVMREIRSYSYDIGARVSGPVLRDRLWFSAAYNPRIARAERRVGTLGTFEDARTAHIFAGKLTWQARPEMTVEFSIFGDPVQHRAVAINNLFETYTPVNPEPYLQQLKTGGVTASLRANASLGAGFNAEASLLRSTITENELASTNLGATAPLVLDLAANTLQGGVPWLSRNEQRRTAATIRLTRATGKHTVVVGAEFEHNRVSASFDNTGIGFTFLSDPTAVVFFDQSQSGTVRNRAPALYLQDTWRATRRLTLNAGVRWSEQAMISNAGVNAQTFAAEWQPRLGFSWEVGRHGRQRFFGSFGRYYQQNPLNLSANFYRDWQLTSTFFSTDPRQPGAVPDSTTTFVDPESSWTTPQPHLKAEHLDEYTAGYERILGTATRVTLRGVRRETSSAFLQVHDSTGNILLGVPGRGALSFLPFPERHYTAVEISVEGTWRRLGYRASYVLSRTYGNYTGLYSSDTYTGSPGQNLGLFYWFQAPNSTGLLPNDRPHVLKLVGSYQVSRALGAGGFFSIMSGTPLNDFGAGPDSDVPSFLAPRGSRGRTPAVLDFNVRLSYQWNLMRGAPARLVIDMLHIGNPQTTVRQDQRHWRTVDAQGNQSSLNPDYLRATAFQPPMAARLGVEVGF